jgi:membrane fusion protein (multidrug efflux system)
MYIQVDQPMFSIVEYDVWIVANYKETQLALMKPGQPVTAEVDAYPGRKITGTVQSIQNGTGSRFTLLPPENATGNYVKIVQRVPVKIVLDPHQNDDGDHLLSPGMSVDPSVKVR